MSSNGESSQPHVVRGSLKLKGGLSLVKSKKKSKKKKSKRKGELHDPNATSSSVASDGKRDIEDVDQVVDDGSDLEETRNKKARHEEEDDPFAGMTESERKFEMMRRKREEALLEKQAEKGFRDRINEFNDKLARMSEHHDVPKVGNAGMG